MNLWLILIGRPDSASGRNAPGKAQRPVTVIGGGVLSNRFSGVPPEVGFGLGQARRFCGLHLVRVTSDHRPTRRYLGVQLSAKLPTSGEPRLTPTVEP